MTGVFWAAFEGLARAVAGTEIPASIETVHAAHIARPGDAPDLWTCAVAERSARCVGHRRSGCRGGDEVSGRRDRATARRRARSRRGAASRGGRGRDPLPCRKGTPDRDPGSKRWRTDCRKRHGASRRIGRLGNASRAMRSLLRTAMVIFGTTGWPIKTHRDHRLRRRTGAAGGEIFRAPAPHRIPFSVDERPIPRRGTAAGA